MNWWQVKYLLQVNRDIYISTFLDHNLNRIRETNCLLQISDSNFVDFRSTKGNELAKSDRGHSDDSTLSIPHEWVHITHSDLNLIFLWNL